MALRNLEFFWKPNKSQIVTSLSKCYSSAGESKTPSDPITHTGQQWDDKDYRLVRFVDKEKKVNKNWAAKLIAEVPPTETKSRVVSCDGGGGLTGHPKVYINLDKPGNHACGYCGLRFKKPSEH